MRRLLPVILSVTFTGLASAVGAVIGYLTAAASELIYGFCNPTFFWKYDDPADQWVYGAYRNAGAVVGAVAGIFLGVWLTRRLLTIRSRTGTDGPQDGQVDGPSAPDRSSGKRRTTLTGSADTPWR